MRGGEGTSVRHENGPLIQDGCPSQNHHHSSPQLGNSAGLKQADASLPELFIHSERGQPADRRCRPPERSQISENLARSTFSGGIIKSCPAVTRPGYNQFQAFIQGFNKQDPFYEELL